MTFLARILPLVLLLTALGARADETCSKPWLFFDLGGVIVDSSDFTKMKFMPEARDYLIEAKRLGFNLGLIVNIPEDWGTTNAQKLARLRKFVNDGWADPVPFDWSQFQTVLVPPNDERRKPDPYLFRKARVKALPCPSFYQGEEPAEVEIAAQVGLGAWQVGQPNKPFFKSLQEISVE